MATSKKQKKAKQQSTKRTYVAFVLDRSGSMSSIHKQTVDSLNEQFGALKITAELGGQTEVTLVQFDTVIDTMFDGVSPEALPTFQMKDFVPRGMTAMYDGIWSAIASLKAKEETDNTGYLVCVLSDGAENASKEVTQAQLGAEIKRLQDSGKWTFTYMLANVDIQQVAQTLHATANNIHAFTSNAAGVVTASYSTTSAIGNYMRGTRGKGITNTSTFYDDSTAPIVQTTTTP